MDPLLEHYMPSLMALKKELPGRQPRSFRESFISIAFFYKVLKNKNNVPRFAFRMFTMIVGLYDAGQKLWL